MAVSWALPTVLLSSNPLSSVRNATTCSISAAVFFSKAKAFVLSSTIACVNIPLLSNGVLTLEISW